jgi:hypothetical protein
MAAGTPFKTHESQMKSDDPREMPAYSVGEAAHYTSKKRSGLNLPSPPEPLVFFVDRSLGRRVIPNALRAAGAQVSRVESCTV